MTRNQVLVHVLDRGRTEPVVLDLDEDGRYPALFGGTVEGATASFFLGWLPGRYTLWQALWHLATRRTRTWVRSWPTTYVRTRGVQAICERCVVLVEVSPHHGAADAALIRHHELAKHDVVGTWLVAQEQSSDLHVGGTGSDTPTVGELRTLVGLPREAVR